MVDRAAIVDTLEQVAERCGDPTPLVYARLFELHPALEPLFDLDRDGSVRGSMIETSIDCILGLAEGSETPRHVISTSRFHHEGYGVPDDQFNALFTAMRDVFRDMLGSAWTASKDEAWTALLEELGAITYPLDASP